MGKQIGSMRFIGRFGNAVGYKARDGRGDAFDAQRIMATTVANPQTLSQMSQRMKLTPVQNFYRGLQGLLDHSWQGVKYGNPSRLHFYSIAMSRLNTSGVPYVLKGDRQFVPWSFPVSSGSIPVVMNPTIPSDVVGYINIPVVASETYDNATTVADLTTNLLNVLGLSEGMQLTFIWVYSKNGQYIPVYKRIILSSTDETELTDLGIISNTESGDDISLAVYSGGAAEESTVVASAVIVSKLVNGVWQRNNASMVIVDSLRTTYNSQTAFNAMLESYRTTKNTSSDWYLNEGDTDSGSTVSTIKEVTAEIGSIEPTFAFYKIGGTKYVPYFVDGEGVNAQAKTYRKESDYAFTKTGASNLGLATAISDTQAEFFAAGYSLVSRTELITLAPELTIPE